METVERRTLDIARVLTRPLEGLAWTRAKRAVHLGGVRRKRMGRERSRHDGAARTPRLPLSVPVIA